MKKMMMLVVALVFAVSASAGSHFNGSWYGVDCYGCPGDANGFNAYIEVKQQKADYTKAKAQYKSTWSLDDVKEASELAFSTFSKAVIWNNYAFHIIQVISSGEVTGKQNKIDALKIAMDAVEKGESILQDSEPLEEDASKLKGELAEGWAKYNAKENKDREKVEKWLKKNRMFIEAMLKELK